MKHILVVDDDPDTLALVADILHMLDYAIETARNGAEAMDRLARGRPDVVLLDLTMPVMDGWAFLQACRADPRYADIPVVVMSGAPAAAEAVRRFGVQRIAKPFDIVPLLATVQETAGQ